MRRAVVFASAEAAEEAFYDAMHRGDLAAMMALWVDDDDAVCVHPSGARLVGLQAIRASFEEIFGQGGVDVRPSRPQIQQSATVAVHNLIERVVVGGRQGPQVVECVTTNVYLKGAAGWRIALHHSSQAGESGATETAPAPSVLH